MLIYEFISFSSSSFLPFLFLFSSSLFIFLLLLFCCRQCRQGKRRGKEKKGKKSRDLLSLHFSNPQIQSFFSLSSYFIPFFLFFLSLLWSESWIYVEDDERKERERASFVSLSQSPDKSNNTRSWKKRSSLFTDFSLSPEIFFYLLFIQNPRRSLYFLPSPLIAEYFGLFQSQNI